MCVRRRGGGLHSLPFITNDDFIIGYWSSVQVWVQSAAPVGSGPRTSLVLQVRLQVGGWFLLELLITAEIQENRREVDALIIIFHPPHPQTASHIVAVITSCDCLFFNIQLLKFKVDSVLKMTDSNDNESKVKTSETTVLLFYDKHGSDEAVTTQHYNRQW